MNVDIVVLASGSISASSTSISSKNAQNSPVSSTDGNVLTIDTNGNMHIKPISDFAMRDYVDTQLATKATDGHTYTKSEITGYQCD